MKMAPQRTRPVAKAPASSYRRRGVSEELHEASFVNFYLAMAAELLVRIGRIQENPYERLLPPKAAARFRAIRRCSFSWMTDRTTLALAARIRGWAPGHQAVRATVLSQLVYTSADVFDAMEDVEGDAAFVSEALRALLLREAAAQGKPPRKTTISKSLQTGALACLGRGKGSIVDKVAAYAAGLGERAFVTWPRLRRARSEAEVTAALARLRLPRFRAHCVGRLLWLHSRGRLGVAPSSLFLGVGARDALLRILGRDCAGADATKDAGLEDLFAAALPTWRAAVLRADEHGIVALLDELCLHPLAAQTFEHLLCEAGKVFGLGGREARGAIKPGYAELFCRAEPFFRW